MDYQPAAAIESSAQYAIQMINVLATTLLNSKAVKYTILSSMVILIVLLTVWAARKSVLNLSENRVKNNQSDKENQLATLFYNALFPYGVVFDAFTDEEEVLALAEETGGAFPEVSRAYRAAFQRDLIDDIRKALDASELREFYSYIQ